MSEETFRKIERKPRNVWSHNEVVRFLQLLKEKHVFGLKGEKRRRLSEFETLLAPMKESGYNRDISQLKFKYKNLKSEYYACKRNNSVMGNNSKTFEYFEQMDKLLSGVKCKNTEFNSTEFRNPKIEIQIEPINLLDPDNSSYDTPTMVWEPTTVSSTSSTSIIEKTGVYQEYINKEQKVDSSVKSFCDSLYDDLKNVPKQNLIKCKIQILETVDKYLKK